MTTIAPSTRDTRIDVLRAVALITIFVNHVPGNPFEPLTHKNFGFSDAAEAFVLISGVSAGLAYGMKFLSGNRLALTLKIWRRACVLYLAQLGTTMATLGIFAFFALAYADPALLEKINIGPVINDTARALVGIVTLGHQLGYNNILSMYAVVLVLLPALLLVGTLSIRLMVAASGLIWFVSGIWRIAPPHYPNDGVWFLNPLSWQFLFVIGLAAMMHVRRGGVVPRYPWVITAALLYVLLSFAWVRIPLWGVDTSMGLPALLTGFDKTYLSVPRLAHVLAIGYLVAVLPAVSNLARTSFDNPLAVMGRHALPVFVLGTVLAMAAQAYRQVDPPGLAADVAIVTAGIAAQFALAYYLDWYQALVRPKRAAAAEPAKRSVPGTPRQAEAREKAA
jgi:hypothetical protein